MSYAPPPSSANEPMPSYVTPPAPAPGATFRAGAHSHDPVPVPTPPNATNKAFLTAWLLSLLLGYLGVDRFYLGKVGTGILKLVTFGGLGVWYLIDLILILTGSATDVRGRPLEGRDRLKTVAWITTIAVVVIGSVIGGVNAANPSESEDAGAPAIVQPEAEAEDASEEVSVEEPVASNAAVEWANNEFGSFEVVTHEGTGDSMVALPAGATGGIVTASHSGSSNFAISVLDAANGSTGELLVNTIGAYSGTTAWGINALGEGVNLKVTADGPWTITLAQIGSAPELAASGTGDAVFLHNGVSGALTATHTGERNFVVFEETTKAFSFGLLINEIGAYSGTVPLSAGPSVITVGADGGWTLAVN